MALILHTVPLIICTSYQEVPPQSEKECHSSDLVTHVCVQNFVDQGQKYCERHTNYNCQNYHKTGVNRH